MSRHELFEELDACNPRWQKAFMSVQQAAAVCGCAELYADWLATADGKLYSKLASVPDYAAASAAEKAALSELPYTLDNIGKTKTVSE